MQPLFPTDLYHYYLTTKYNHLDFQQPLKLLLLKHLNKKQLYQLLLALELHLLLQEQLQYLKHKEQLMM